MKELIESLVADFDAAAVPGGTQREVALPALPGKADVVIGMRRSGKTWRLYQEIHRLLSEGVESADILYLSFEDERLLPLEGSQLQWILEAFQVRRLGRETPMHLFFDEMQNVPGWERWIRRLLDQENVKIVLSGSSAKLLGREIATSLRGRALPTELLPFSFAEMLRHHGEQIPASWPPKGDLRRRLGRSVETYLHDGGFPEVQGQPQRLRVRILQDYIDVVLLRDVAERHGLENLAALRYLQRSLLSRPSGRFSVHKLYNDLKSQGVKVSKDGLHDYLGHLEDAFLFFTVEIHSRSLRQRKVNPRKCYPVDPGLSTAISYEAEGDIGHLLETVVYLELRRRGYEMAWVRTESGREVDFHARGLTGERLLVQVSADLSNEATRKRELTALAEAMSELGFEEGWVVTLWEQETLEVDAGRIRIVPAWRWLLEDRRVTP